ncbi:MAG: aminotransferase class III-fold pyridoxal phosphate-dependent enzyme, partial [Victivallaceae bacterium]|nr:aminotransferase class III-fold pyridoxal phosphate-dependent enzyme [Victivallaceae bacterium]
MVAKRKYSGILKVGMHASTFGGTALVSAAALAVQKAFDNEGVLENCRKTGEYLRGELRRIGAKYSFVKQVRGMGLMNGVVLDREAATLAGLCLKQKLVVLTAGETVLRLLPPLNLCKADADEGVRRIDAAMAELAELIKGEALK